MVDSLKLKAAMLAQGITAEVLADNIGISQQSLSYKINNKREFKATEIKKICDILSLSLQDRELIFFAGNVDALETD